MKTREYLKRTIERLSLEKDLCDPTGCEVFSLFARVKGGRL